MANDTKITKGKSTIPITTKVKKRKEIIPRKPKTKPLDSTPKILSPTESEVESLREERNRLWKEKAAKQKKLKQRIREEYQKQNPDEKVETDRLIERVDPKSLSQSGSEYDSRYHPTPYTGSGSAGTGGKAAVLAPPKTLTDVPKTSTPQKQRRISTQESPPIIVNPPTAPLPPDKRPEIDINTATDAEIQAWMDADQKRTEQLFAPDDQAWAAIDKKIKKQVKKKLENRGKKEKPSRPKSEKEEFQAEIDELKKKKTIDEEIDDLIDEVILDDYSEDIMRESRELNEWEQKQKELEEKRGGTKPEDRNKVQLPSSGSEYDSRYHPTPYTGSGSAGTGGKAAVLAPPNPNAPAINPAFANSALNIASGGIQNKPTAYKPPVMPSTMGSPNGVYGSQQPSSPAKPVVAGPTTYQPPVMPIAQQPIAANMWAQTAAKAGQPEVAAFWNKVAQNVKNNANKPKGNV